MFIYRNDVDSLKAQIDELQNDLNQLAEKARKISRHIITTEDRPRTIISYFVRHVNKLIAQGVEENEAVEMTRDDLGLSNDSAQWAWHRVKNHKKALDRYSKAYLSRILRKKGLSYAKIGEILSISATHVKRLLNKEIVE